MRRKILTLTLLLTSLFPGFLLAQHSPIITDFNLLQPSPFANWKTLKTTHFNINYQQEHFAFAQRMAIIAEKVHEKHSPLMRWNPVKNRNSN